MKPDRRGFLKLFGLTSAAVAVAPSIAAAPPVEIITSPTPPEPLPVSDGFEAPTGIRQFGIRHLDVRDEPLWSKLTVERNNMQARYTLFQDFHSSLGETNMVMPGRLPAPEMFCVKQIGFLFSPGAVPALRSAFIDRYALQLYLGRRRYWESPLAAVFSVGEPDRTKGFTDLPDAGFHTLEIPLVIENEISFSLEVSGTPIAPCGKLEAWVVFKGLHACGIQ